MKNVDKTNGNVNYFDDIHEYRSIDGDEKYTSVTQLISKYTPPYDADF
jgi:hypothetical protein